MGKKGASEDTGTGTDSMQGQSALEADRELDARTLQCSEVQFL